MPRSRSRLLVLVLITLGFLFPALATALPLGDATLSVAEHHEAPPGLSSQLWSVLSALWAETGSILDPNATAAGASSGAGAEPGAASSADNGSGLDPDG